MQHKKKKSLMGSKFFAMLTSGTLTMMVVSILLMADSIVAGMCIGSDAVAGITLVTPVYSLAAFFGSVFSLGVPIVYSNEMGKFNKRGADESFGVGLLMSILIGIVLFVAATLFGDWYLAASHPSAAVLAEARGYLSFMRFTMLLMPAGMLISETVYADGDETLATLANVLQGGGNLLASILLARVMGNRGIGLASFLFNALSIAVLMLHFLKKSNSLRLNLFFSVDILKRVVRYSLIDSSSYLFLGALTAVLNAFVGAVFGPKYLILVSVIALTREFQLVFDGIGEAITPIISVYLGEECSKGVQNIFRLAEKTAIVEGIVVTLVLILAAPLLPGILDITDPELVRLATGGIRLLALGSTFTSLLYLLTSYYLLIEKVGLGIVVSALRDVALSAPLAVLLGTVVHLVAGSGVGQVAVQGAGQAAVQGAGQVAVQAAGQVAVQAAGVYGLFLGLALAPLLAYLVTLAWIAWRYGRENCPIFLKELGKGVRSEVFDLTTEMDEIMELQRTVSGILKEEGMSRRTVNQAELLIEELFLLIREKNGGKGVRIECALLLKPEGAEIVIRDDGVFFDISDENAQATSTRAFVVSCYMEQLGENKHHLKTMSFNRSAFRIGK